MPIFKSRATAERDGDTLYAPGSKEAIKGFLAAHGGHVSADRIIDYMTEMYGTSEATTRMHLSELTRAGEIDHPTSPILDNRPGQRGRSYAIKQDASSDEYTGGDWI